MKRFLLCFPLFFLLNGCAAHENQRVEINQGAGQILPVSALALDTHPDGYQMTVESIRQDSLDGNAAPSYFMVEAADFDALFVRADELLASRLSLSHALVILLSDDIAADALDELTASLLKRPDARLTLRFAVVHDATPDRVLRAQSVNEGIPGIALAALLDKRAADGSLADCPLFRVLDAQARGRAFSLPVLQLNTDGHAAPSGNVPIGGANHAA